MKRRLLHRYWIVIAFLMCAGLINAQQINPASESGDSFAGMSVSEPVSQDETVNKINHGIVSMVVTPETSRPDDAGDASRRKAPARKTNVSGSVYASSLVENDNIVLTGNTTLFMDSYLTLTSIRGDYSLNVQGDHVLTVKNPDGVAIRVRSFNSTCTEWIHLSAKYEAITTKTTDNYEGDITVKGRLSAVTTSENDYCIVGKNVTLDTGSDYGNIIITSKYIAVCSYGDMTLDHKVQARASGHNVPAFAIFNGGNLLIKEHGNIDALGYGYGIYATGNITMEGGILRAGGSESMVDKLVPAKLNGIVSTGGNVSLTGKVDVMSEQPAITGTDVTINGNLTAETTEEEFYCIIGRNTVTLNGDPININSINYAVCSYGDMTLSGDITANATGHGASAFNVRNVGNLLIKDGSNITALGGGNAIYAEGSITMEGGRLEAEGAAYEGIMSRRGNISLKGNINVKAAKCTLYAQDGKNGDITVEGDLTAETTGEDFYCISGNVVDLDGGTMKITAKASAVRSFSNMWLSGDITATSKSGNAFKASSTGTNKIYITDGSTITATSSGSALYATGDVNMHNGTLKAESTSESGIYSSRGDVYLVGTIDVKSKEASLSAKERRIFVTGDLTAETTGDSYYCIEGGKWVDLDGGTIKITSAGRGIHSGDEMILSGDITVLAHNSAIVTNGGDITLEGGTLTARGEKGGGIDSNGGTISLTGTVDVKSDEVAVRGGVVIVNGNLTAETTLEDFYCVVCMGGSSLTGGTIKITSMNYAVCSYGDLTLSGNISAIATRSDASAFNIREGGNLLIKDGSSITALGGGNAIYAEGSITMEGGTLKARGTAYEGIMSRRGNISLTGDIDIEAEKQSLYAEGGDITVKGFMKARNWGEFNCVQGKKVTLDGKAYGEISIVSMTDNDGVVSYGNMNLFGNIRVRIGRAHHDGAMALRSYDGGNIYFGKGYFLLDSFGSGNYAIYADGQIAFDLSLAILEPENGRISDHTIVDANGKTTHEVRIGYTKKVLENSLLATPTVNYGQQARVEGTIKAIGKCTYTMQESADGNTWRTIKSGTIEREEARAGTTVLYKKVLAETGYEAYRQYRMIVAHAASGERDTSATTRINYRYPLFRDGHVSDYYGAGDVFHYAKPADCRDYKYTSQLPQQVKEYNDYLSITMPACPLYIDEYTPIYSVDFHDADGTLIHSEEVEAGKDATPPSMGGEDASGRRKAQRVFRGWDKDYTNVHKNLKVFAKYDVYVDLDMDMVEHICDRTEDWNFSSITFTELEGNKELAMAGDKLTFRASVKTNTPVDVYFQSGTPLASGEISWTTGQHVGEITGYDVNKVMTFDRQVTAVVEYYNELPFEKSRYYRFYAKGNGTAETIYSPAMEVQMFYPLLVTADQELVVLTAQGFGFNGKRSIVPVKYDEKVYFLDPKGLRGAGLTYARVNKPNFLQEGYSDDGFHYILGPGETESLNVTTTKKLVIFDGVYGNGYPKQLDFSAEGFGKINGYYGEIVPCGGSVTLPPEPTEENAVFLGWTSWDPEAYDSLAYMNVPAISENVIGFTANFEYYDPTPQYTVRFFAKDGSTLLDTQMVTEGSDATPPAAPEVDGWHFTGWNKSYETITEDVDITAVYGEETKVWTVTYKNWDGSDLGSEEVKDGEAAVGVEATREGYTFVKWRDYTSGEDVDMEHITANITVEAVFTETLYTVTYRVDGVSTYTIQVVEGFAANSIYYPYGTPTKDATEALVYTFDYWAPEVETITEDVTFDAVFVPTARLYNVSFQNWDHTLLSEQQVAYGTSAIAPSEPKREGYVFDGWDREFDAVLADMRVTAKFRLAGTYTISWLNDDESLIDQTTVVEGETPTHADPSKPATAEYTYIFTGWSPNIEPVTGDASYTATYEATKNKYIISADAINGKVEGAGEYEYGDIVDLTAIPDEGYIFYKWSDGVTDNPRTVTVTENATYTALFEDPDGIKGIKSDNDVKWYDLTGRRISTPRKGVNIIRNSDGTSRKVLQK